MKKQEFEDALKQLEGIVEKLEGQDLSLEDSLKAFEEGVRLTRFCHHKLNEAEKKIEILTKDDDGGEKIEPFDLESTAE
ncbi:MAG: exodeoxyribonuclease VII small subunit [Deltaproteobacteria bacterium]|nr:exodeoxyribonuclease VII small subunit [Deltaproteobacteria bacterium]